MHPKRSHMVEFFFWVSSRDYFALDPRPLRAVKNTKVGGSGGRVPTRLRAQDAKVKLIITPPTYFRPRFARGEVPAPIPGGPAAPLQKKRLSGKSFLNRQVFWRVSSGGPGAFSWQHDVQMDKYKVVRTHPPNSSRRTHPPNSHSAHVLCV